MENRQLLNQNKQHNRKILVWLVVLAGGLICLRSISSAFLYPLVLVLIAIFAFVPLKSCLPLLCFLFPFATIIKTQPGQVSLFTVMFLIFVIRIVLKKGSLKRIFLVSLLFFVAYAFIISGTSKIILIATMACGFIMVHDVCQNDEYDYTEVFYAFCAGIILASVLGMLRDYLPIIDNFVRDSAQRIGHNEHVERFVGLVGNPNYFTMDISVALSCLVVSMATSKPKKINVLLFVILSVFGLMSVSKSFLIVWVVLLLILMFYGLRNGGSSFVKLFVVLVITAVFVYVFAKESIDTYIYRLTQDSEGDLSGFTSGRTEIWLTYIKAIISDIRILFFGSGVGVTLVAATHNTYLEPIYYLGVVGCVLYFFVFKMSVSLKSLPKKYVYYIPVLVMLIRFMGISVFVHDSFWYYLLIICLSLKNGAAIENAPNTPANPNSR